VLAAVFWKWQHHPLLTARANGDGATARYRIGQAQDMAVKIRLTRTGGKNDVCYRVVAADGRSPRDGRFLEILGWYDPKRTGVNFELKRDRIDHWKSLGAQVSETVRSLLVRSAKA
jgi:small subunit ribosomal protein S16